MEPKQAGERLLQLAREVIADVHHMRTEMGNYARGPQSVLRLHGNTSAMTRKRGPKAPLTSTIA